MKRDIEALYPLSHLQQGMLFHAQLAPGASVYFEQTSVVLTGVDAQRFEAAWQEVVARHSVLRTTFLWGEGLREPLQAVHRTVPVAFAREDWRALSAATQAERRGSFLAADRARPFDLKRAPLLRFAWIQLAADRALFVFSHPHLLLDGWSAAQLFREVVAIYEARGVSQSPRLPPPTPYQQFIAWLRAQDRAAAEAAWRAALAGFRSPTPLPPSAPGAKGERTLSLSPAQSAALVDLARRCRVTMSTVVQAAWGLLLGRLAGQRDVVFGVTVAGRPAELPGIEHAVGLFINTIPLRVRLADDQSVADWLANVQAALATTRPYEWASLVDIQRWSDLPAGTALFDTIVGFQNYPLDAALRGGPSGMSLGALEVHEQNSFPLTLLAAEQETLALQLAHDERFSGTAIDTLLARLVALLTGMAAGGATRVGQLSLLLPGEGTLLHAQIEQQPDQPLVPVLFAAQAARTPDAIALADDDGTLTYAELLAHARGLAGALVDRGLGPEDLVGLCCTRRRDFIIGLLAAWQAGAAFLPLDPALPDQRLAFMLGDARPRLVLGDAAQLARLPRTVPQLELDAVASTSTTAPALAPTNLAYAIYTSGSTGQPKAVLIQHGALARLARAEAATFAVAASDRVLQFASPGFDTALSEILMALLAGARLELAPAGAVGGTELERLITTRALRVVTLPPSVLATLAPEALAGLRALIVGGESCPPAVAARVCAALPTLTLFNAYGPTEGTITATIARADSAETMPPVIGQAIAGTSVYLLDDALAPVPAGVVGEIYLGGAGVARGYLGRPGLTAARFVPDPHSDLPGARMYRTGDLGRWQGDQLVCLGRADDQVKLRGHRIELAEVEAVLLADARVATAAAAVRGEHLVGYVVLRDPEADPELVLAELRTAAAATLPEALVPAALVTLPALPLTLNGKLDRAALPEPDAAARAPGRAEVVAPRTPNESAVAQIFAEVLELTDVSLGVDDDFFDLGGHSLLATQVTSRLRTRLGVELPLATLFEASTVAALAAALDARPALPRPPLHLVGAAGPPLRPVPRTGPLPLSFAQQRLWFLDRLEPGNPAYHVPAALRIDGPLDETALRAAFTALVARHEALRTRFGAADGEPVQLIDPPHPFPLHTLSLEGRPDDEQFTALAHLAAAEAAAPFDLIAGPLLRATLVRLAPEKHALLFTMHHIAADGWSMGVFLRELAALYQASTRGEPPALPPLSLQYADYAVWQRQWLSGPVLDEQIAYWRQRLTGLPTLALPTDNPRPPRGPHAGAALGFTLSPGVTAGLRALSQRQGTTLFMTLMATFQVLLGRLCGQQDFGIGVTVANRTLTEVEPLIGFFVNTVVLRADLSGEPRFLDVLARVQKDALGAFAHQAVPFERLVEELNVARDTSRNPLFQVLFTVQNTPAGVIDAGPLRFSPLPVPCTSAQFDLALSMHEAGEALTGELVFSTELFSAATAERLLQQLTTLLTAVATTPDSAIAELPLSSPADLDQSLRAWNDTAVTFPSTDVLDLFEAQVRQHPDSPAVIDEAGHTLTYAALDRRANQLAHVLRRAGVGRGRLCGVCLGRSADLVVAMLATLKAGGAYVPLDPEIPPERLAVIAAETHMPVLLTDNKTVTRVRGSVPLVLCLEASRSALASEPAHAPARSTDPRDLAYVIYTSGSTGLPKGVMIEHGALANYLHHCRVVYGLTAGQGAPVQSSIAFDLTVTSLLAPLCAGGVVLPIAADGREGLAALAAAVTGPRPLGLVKLTPAYLALLGHAIGDAPVNVSTFVVGGEALPVDVVAFWQRRAPHTRIINEYGPTEATVGCIIHEVPPGAPLPAAIPIGRPIANTRAYILDGALHPVPVGVAGELYLGGVGLARGYFNRPGLTAERFLPDPFGPPGARLYRTGDWARTQADGTMDYLGRLDDQIKLRGHRIELGEIEACLSQHADVAHAVVVAHGVALDDTRLVAYVVANGSLDLPALAAWLRERLPEYMVPASLVPLPSLPLNTNGKVDRRALPPPSFTSTAPATTLAPRTALELGVLQIFEEVLEKPDLGMDADFFEQGGHSLLAVRLVTELAARFGQAPELTDVFQTPTPAAVAALLTHDGAAAPAASLCVRLAEGQGPGFFCVHPAGGTSLGYWPLADRLRPRRRFFGLEAAGLGADAAPDVTVEAMATRYLTELRRQQPQGPYHLGGWSFGGLVAFELACRLTSAGETVATLVLFDVPAPDPTPPACDDLPAVLAGTARQVGVALDPNTLADRASAIAAIARGAITGGLLPAATAAAQIERFVNVALASENASRHYRPGHFPGVLHLVRAADNPLTSGTGWAPHATRVVVHETPGQHDTLLSPPHVDAVAALLSRLLTPAELGLAEKVS